MEPTTLPRLDPAAFERIRTTLDSGALPAAEALATELRDVGDLQAYFYALLLKKRVELGASPFPTGPGADLPAGTQEAYEDAIREAGRTVGQLYLDRGEIPQAWLYFRMLGEHQPVREAIDQYNPSPEVDAQQVIEIAFHQGVHPEKGFDLILDRYGICSSITIVSGQDFSQHPDLYAYCVRNLVRALAEQLAERLRSDIASRGEETPPEDATIGELIAGRDWLFADDAYHIDVSHLSSVVQMSLRLPDCPELRVARDLCRYGERLGSMYHGRNDPPFERNYTDYGLYLDVLMGDNTEEALAYFHEQAAKGMQEGYGFPAEILVNLLLRVDRPQEALAVAREFLSDAEERDLTCPGLYELCHKAGDFRAMAEIAQQRGEGVPYLAALIRQG